MKQQIILMLVAIAAGAVLPVQAGLNVQLGKAFDHPIFAAFASFIVGAVALLVYLFFQKFELSTLSNVREVPVAAWLGGILGAFYVVAVIILAPKLGAALTFSLIVAGQMTVSLALDHYGMMGMPVSSINWQRLLGVALLIVGVILIRKF
ncbi:MAG: DMT family transporter [Bacteroidota bacterium]